MKKTTLAVILAAAVLGLGGYALAFWLSRPDWAEIEASRGIRELEDYLELEAAS